MGNIAYIDNQNLYMSTHHADDPWQVDMRRFRVYLKEKYGVETANIFVGAFDEKYRDMYKRFHDYGYALVFREHAGSQLSRKKGNVDADIVFEMMLDAYANPSMEKAVLVSGDGDYKKVVDHLIAIGKFERLLLPSHKNASFLYRKTPESFKAYLDQGNVRNRIERRQ